MTDPAGAAAVPASGAMARIIKTRLESSSIASIAYAPDEELLEVQFRRTGHFYDYLGVPPETFRALMEAESKGTFLNEVIKPNFDHIRAEFPIA
jgi:hypothetical protein